MSTPSLPEELRERLADVRSVGAITGAGVSAESGIQTYRGQGGLYDDPEEGDRTVEALTGTTLARDPDRTWRVVAELASRSAAAEPNAGHHALVEMERRAGHFVLLTQNVDGLHQLAGSRNVIDIHGNVFATRCMACPHRGELDRSELAALEAAPRCPSCEGTLRPDAVLFGEMLPEAKVRRLDAELRVRIPDLVVVAGTTGLFPYIAEPVTLASIAGKLTVEVNPEPTHLTHVVDFPLHGPAGEWLPRIAEALPDRSEARPTQERDRSP